MITHIYITGDPGSPNGADVHIFDISTPNQQATELFDVAELYLRLSANTFPMADIMHLDGRHSRNLKLCPAPKTEGINLASAPKSRKRECPECFDTGYWHSPLTGKKSPCSQNCPTNEFIDPFSTPTP